MKLDDLDRTRLSHMIEAAESALEFAAGRRLEDFRSDRMLLFAVARAVEIIAEAASKVSPQGEPRCRSFRGRRSSGCATG